MISSPVAYAKKCLSDLDKAPGHATVSHFLCRLDKRSELCPASVLSERTFADLRCVLVVRASPLHEHKERTDTELRWFDGKSMWWCSYIFIIVVPLFIIFSDTCTHIHTYTEPPSNQPPQDLLLCPTRDRRARTRRQPQPKKNNDLILRNIQPSNQSFLCQSRGTPAPKSLSSSTIKGPLPFLYTGRISESILIASPFVIVRSTASYKYQII